MSDDDEDDDDIVEIEGRKPYDKSVPRLARDEYEDRQPPPGYVSWQSKINSGPGGTINDAKLEKYLNGVGNIYEEVDPEDIDNIPSGSRIAYITKTNKWRSAGWLSRVEESDTDADGNPFEDGPKKYVLYKSYNNACFSVQVEDVEMFYVMKPKGPEVIVQKMIYFKKPTKRTNFPVKIEDEDGYEVVVAYLRDDYNRKKFMATEKYKNAKKDPEGWSFDDGTQEPDVRD
jgi:hypothetical protein